MARSAYALYPLHHLHERLILYLSNSVVYSIQIRFPLKCFFLYPQWTNNNCSRWVVNKLYCCMCRVHTTIPPQTFASFHTWGSFLATIAWTLSPFSKENHHDDYLLRFHRLHIISATSTNFRLLQNSAPLPAYVFVIRNLISKDPADKRDSKRTCQGSVRTARRQWIGNPAVKIK
jgi:hypothetical protein